MKTMTEGIYRYNTGVRLGNGIGGRVLRKGGVLPPLKHLPLYLLVNLPEGNPRHSPLYLRLWLGSATYIRIDSHVAAVIRQLQQ